MLIENQQVLELNSQLKLPYESYSVVFSVRFFIIFTEVKFRKRKVVSLIVFANIVT